MSDLLFVPGLRRFHVTGDNPYELDKHRRLLLPKDLVAKLAFENPKRDVYLWPDKVDFKRRSEDNYSHSGENLENTIFYVGITKDRCFVASDIKPVEHRIDGRNRVVISRALYEGVFLPDECLGLVEMGNHIGIFSRNVLHKRGPEISDYVKKHYSS